MSTQKRAYTLRARARRQEETRRRIVAATAALHEEIGPALTTVTEIARRAGVQRLTVYSHFPEERELFAACSAHWLQRNAPPDHAQALVLGDPWQRVRAVLGSQYAWYRANSRVQEHVHRDRLVMPALDSVARGSADAPLAALADALAAAIDAVPARRRRVRAVLGLALDFWTWRRLAMLHLDDGEAADLMLDAIRAAAEPTDTGAQTGHHEHDGPR